MKELTIRKIISKYIPNETISSDMVDELYEYANQRVIEDVSEDTNIFGKISGPQYKEFIEGYQNKSGEEFDEWYKSLPNEERDFLSSMFD